MSYKPIGSYGVVGDMRSAALIAQDGSVDWLCLPRFDSPSVFAAILDDRKGGHFALRPAALYRSSQRYLTNTNVLCTTFITSSGSVEVLDLMPVGNDTPAPDQMLLRIVRGLDGQVDMICAFQPRLDYARGETKLRGVAGGALAENGAMKLALTSPAPLEISSGVASASFIVRKGQGLAFALCWGADRPPDASHWSEVLSATAGHWRRLAESISYNGRWRDEVLRSVLALHMLVFKPAGTMVAAVTTSLPEWPGGARNWDYRFCWVRDAAFTMDALNLLGHESETVQFFKWLTEVCPRAGSAYRRSTESSTRRTWRRGRWTIWMGTAARALSA